MRATPRRRRPGGAKPNSIDRRQRSIGITGNCWSASAGAGAAGGRPRSPVTNSASPGPPAAAAGPPPHHAIDGLAADVQDLVILVLARLGGAVEQVCRWEAGECTRVGAPTADPRAWAPGRLLGKRSTPRERLSPLALLPRLVKAATGMAGQLGRRNGLGRRQWQGGGDGRAARFVAAGSHAQQAAGSPIPHSAFKTVCGCRALLANGWGAAMRLRRSGGGGRRRRQSSASKFTTTSHTFGLAVHTLTHRNPVTKRIGSGAHVAACCPAGRREQATQWPFRV